MADRLSRVLGTEEDKVNCPFYFKIGACRHGDRCSRNHLRPNFSQTLLIPHLYIPPPPDPTTGAPTADPEEHFEEFYEELLEEFQKFGEVEELHTVENLGDHMFGNIYVKYRKEEEAEGCLKAMTGRYYAGRIVSPEYCPVTDFTDARCRQFDEGTCQRGGYCNFVHLRHVSRSLRRLLAKSKRRDRGKDRDRGRDRDRDRGRDRDRDRDRRDRGRDRDRRDRSRSRDKEGGGDMARSTSEERRAKIASWNKKREEPAAAPAAEADAAPAAAPPAAPETAEAAPAAAPENAYDPAAPTS